MNSSMLLKLFEYSIEPVLKKYLKINPLQFGFTHDSNCAKAITMLKEIVMNYKNGGSSVYVASIDMSKAYDKINCNILIDKLLSTDLPIPIIKIIAFMLKNTYANIRFNDYVGDEFHIKNGVRQGGVLSSLLFNFYINEVIDKISSLNYGCSINYKRCNIIGYADDLIAVSSSSVGLQNILDLLGATLQSLCLKINITKSVYMIFKSKKSKIFDHKIYLCGNELCRVTQIKYLGVIITDNLHLDAEIGRASGDFLKQFNSFYYKFNFLPDNILSYLFKTYTSGFYGCNVWFEQCLSDNKLRKISVIYHKAVKKVAGMRPWDSNHDACSSVRVNIFKHLLAKRIFNHFKSLISSSNAVISTLKYYFMFKSNINSYMTSLFENVYGLNNYKFNDNNAIRSRIDFTEQHEPRSFYNQAVA